MKRKIKILIVDDHPIIRNGLQDMLGSKNDYYSFIIEGAETAEQAIVKVKKNHYDLVLMDFSLPAMNGIQATRTITAHKPNLKVLALSQFDERGIINSFLNAGASGYLLKNAGIEEYLKAITTVLNGKKYFSSEIANMLLNEAKQTPSGEKLSKRDMVILNLIAEGNTTRHIADKLCVSIPSINKYRIQLLKKLKAKNVAGLLMNAKKLKLVY